MNKPDPKDFPPESPHDLEWGGYNHAKYQVALVQWQASESIKSGFFPRQDIGPTPEDIEMFEKHAYWTKDEVYCYNHGVEAALNEVYEKKRIYESIHRGHRQLPMLELFFDEIIVKIKALKK